MAPPLHLAVRNSNVAEVRALLSREAALSALRAERRAGADPNERSGAEVTPLHEACDFSASSPSPSPAPSASSRASIARELIAAGADVTAISQSRHVFLRGTPLHVLCWNAERCGDAPELARVLLGAGASLAGTPSVLELAAWHSPLPFAELLFGAPGRGGEVAALLNAPGPTPLLHRFVREARGRRAPERVRLLLRGGANHAARDDQGSTPLLAACRRLTDKQEVAAECEIVKLLAGPSVLDTPDNYGIRPIQVAAFKGRLDAVRALAERGANVAPAGGKSPLVLADLRGAKDVSAFLRTRGAGP